MRHQNNSTINSLSFKVNTLTKSLGYEAACKIKHNAFYTLFVATYGPGALDRSVERCLRKSVERLHKVEVAS
jgi:hypothetical protein